MHREFCLTLNLFRLIGHAYRKYTISGWLSKWLEVFDFASMFMNFGAGGFQPKLGVVSNVMWELMRKSESEEFGHYFVEQDRERSESVDIRAAHHNRP